MEKEKFIFSLMHKATEDINVYARLQELEKRINKLIHIKMNTKVIDLTLERIDIEVKIGKIDIGFSKYISFNELKDIDKVEKSLKHQIETVIKLYFGL